MTKVLIGALGLGRRKKDGSAGYEGTTYGFEDGTTDDADFFIYALTRYVKPDHLIIIATEAVKKTALAELTEWIALEGVPITIVDIPNGRNRNEAWTIFNAVVAKYDELFPEGTSQPEVYMDVTNGLRSIPILMLSIARYLQRSRRMDLRGIFYGAYDAADQTEVVKPVYQVDSFITVLDWASAVDTFKRTGNAILLAELLAHHQPDLAFPNLQELIQALQKLSRSLDLTLSQTIVVSAHQLTTVLLSVPQPEKSLYPLSVPIFNLLEGLRQEFAPFAISEPQNDVSKFLKATFTLIEWYLVRERYTNAVQLAREWCITWCMFRDKKPQPDLWQYKKRQNFANFLTDDADVGSFWEKLRNLRNRITHTESEERDFDVDDPAQLDTTINDVKEVIQQVLALRSKVEKLCSSSTSPTR